MSLADHWSGVRRSQRPPRETPAEDLSPSLPSEPEDCGRDPDVGTHGGVRLWDGNRWYQGERNPSKEGGVRPIVNDDKDLSGKSH